MEKIRIIECIDTWQGEGPSSGRRMLLVRFKTCNRVVEKRPCKFCDTLVKMKTACEMEISLESLQKTIDDKQLGLMITGGEPGYNSNFHQTISLINNLQYPIANIETNGCQLKELISSIDSSKNVQYIYSPKFFNEAELQEEKERVASFSNEPNVNIKIVYNDSNLMAEYLSYVTNLGMNIKTYLMPEGISRNAIVEHAQNKVFDAAEVYKMNFSSRDHVVYGFV